MKENKKLILQTCSGADCSARTMKEYRKMEEILQDRSVTLLKTRCLGLCRFAAEGGITPPFIKHDDTIYSNLTPSQINRIIDELTGMKHEASVVAWGAGK